ncbi:hypothetical protein VPNG_00423 [Cytospora leucostoma]|uniref:Cation efflux protein transmembrane domain-containing protein n=1 Tax=Cytospora leucostoma TaxID=1230097 RepID=A0A423XN80_9PEZI|nr:hypothetical protein VPNG_00423 [Cytospora leucostoma]
MTSPSHPRRPSSLLLQDEPTVLASKGNGTLTALIKNRSSHASVQSPSWKAFSDEEESVGGEPFPEWTEFRRRNSVIEEDDDERRSLAEERRLSALLTGPQMRSLRLIGTSSPRYSWERYWKTEDQLKGLRSKPVRAYYERTNYLIQQYLYIDKLLDSSLPHDLLNEYNNMPLSSFRRGVEVPTTISEEPSPPGSLSNGEPIHHPANGSASASSPEPGYNPKPKKVKRTPKDIYRPSEITPLGARIVTVAIYVNFLANLVLLLAKVAVVLSVPSVSVLASLVDAALDFLSTVIVWTTTTLIATQDYRYPVGRRRLEPVGVLVFSVIMITSFTQVALAAAQQLASADHTVIQLTASAIGIMLGTIFVKGLCWFWCRLVRNSSVQALADDAATDMIFNAGSIAFPIVGYYAGIWWLDALGGLLLSCVVIFNWSRSAREHIKNLCGLSATADQRNILLYLTTRFARSIRQIQGLQAYHAGDKLNVEVDIVLDASTSLKDSHDLAESLQYVLESVPIVDRAFVHCDYASYNLPTHMEQQAG